MTGTLDATYKDMLEEELAELQLEALGKPRWEYNEFAARISRRLAQGVDGAANSVYGEGGDTAYPMTRRTGRRRASTAATRATRRSCARSPSSRAASASAFKRASASTRSASLAINVGG